MKKLTKNEAIKMIQATSPKKVILFKDNIEPELKKSLKTIPAKSSVSVILIEA